MNKLFSVCQLRSTVEKLKNFYKNYPENHISPLMTFEQKLQAEEDVVAELEASANLAFEAGNWEELVLVNKSAELEMDGMEWELEELQLMQTGIDKEAVYDK